MQSQNPNPTYLSQLPCLYPMQGGNPSTRIQIIGQDANQQTPKYVKKTIVLNQDNQRYAYAERTMMHIIQSDYVIRLLHWEETQEQQVSKSRIGRQSQLVKKKLILYMPYCEKGDLRSYLINSKPSIEKRVQIFLDILYAMRFLHQKFIIHRDMKLQNVFVTKDDQIKIADLGIASQTFSIAQSQAGTFGQQAPQVYLKHKQGYDEKADVWSVGYMAFQILNQVIRKQEELGREIRDPYLPKEQLRLRVLESHGGNLKQNYLKSFQQNKLIFNPEVPHTLKYLIGKMLMPRREERVSFREIYEGGYLQKLEEEWGQEKVGTIRNYKALVGEYPRIYAQIEQKKKEMERNNVLYTIVIRLNDQIEEKLYPSGIVSPIVSPNLVDLLMLQFLLLHRLRAIYTQTKQLQCFTLKKKIQQFVNNIGTRYLQVRNSVQDYLKATSRKPINQNPELMSNQYFVQLLNDMSLKYALDVGKIVELVGGQSLSDGNGIRQQECIKKL